jgi:hypothetical protein
MHVEAALRAVEREVLELAFEIGLHLQELEASIFAWMVTG